MIADLKPCPFCGGHNAKMRGNIHVGYFIECPGCFTTGLIGDTKTEAVDAWNTRAEPDLAVDVKPLEWERSDPDDQYYDHHMSSGLHDYDIYGNNDSDIAEIGFELCIDGERLKNYPTLEAAKAAAEADHRERILSQITTRSVDDVLEEAACIIHDLPRDKEEWVRESLWNRITNDMAYRIRNLKSKGASHG